MKAKSKFPYLCFSIAIVVSANLIDLDLYSETLNRVLAVRDAKQFGTPSGDRSTDIAMDSYGNIYITGWTEGNLDGNVNQGSTDMFYCQIRLFRE
jgi:hypothetical protein